MTAKYQLEFPSGKQPETLNETSNKPGGLNPVGCDKMGRIYLNSDNDRKEVICGIITEYPDVCLIDQYDEDGQFIASYDVEIGQWSDENLLVNEMH